MCRFLIYNGTERATLSSVICEPSCSLLKQATSSRLRLDPSQTVNADGFGVGWYTETEEGVREPCVLTSVRPAWSCTNLGRLAPRLRSKLIFAHVRAGTRGTRTENDCHPFEYGNLIWMHNGSIGHWDDVKRPLAAFLSKKWFLNIRGHTDSEWAFAVFLTILERHGHDPATCSEQGFDPAVLRHALVKTIQKIGELSSLSSEPGADRENSYLNFAVSDGRSVVVSRYVNHETANAASLFYCQGASWKKQDADRDYAMRSGTLSTSSRAVLVASEPLTENSEQWREVPRNTTLTAIDGQVAVEPIVFREATQARQDYLKRSHRKAFATLDAPWSSVHNDDGFRRKSCVASLPFSLLRSSIQLSVK